MSDKINWSHGNEENNVIRGNKEEMNYLAGFGGDDVLVGYNKEDVLDGGAEDDVLISYEGNDTLYGGAGDDILQAGAGADLLYGGAGDDILQAGAGDDILEAGAGADLLDGGAGADTFRYNDNSDSNIANFDTIRDFVDGEDIIDLSALGYIYSDLNLERDGSSTIITHTDGLKIVLENIIIDAMDESDFIL